MHEIAQNCVCNAQKIISSWGFSQDPARGVYGAPSSPLAGWGGGKPLHWHHSLNAFSVSLRRLRRLKSNVPLPKQFSGSASDHDNDSHKPWWPHTCFLKTTWPWIWRFIKSTPLVLHVFIAVAVMVYLVAVKPVMVTVCGRHGCGRHDISPNTAPSHITPDHLN